ncbi:hypothetical protein P3W24_09485 [Luteibacter sp. PPL201]|jgi:hypothetical protein|uniref:Secreted protein n=1 Tax=Luteibacter sahnii TaxID=3021977 RepID=A0ABT6BAT8_9GAMM|nr:hypothetical protein [Luteibacter sp. PPL193]MDY1547170.1 hypothetical protein [Luteibacter sp. PPL193]
MKIARFAKGFPAVSALCLSTVAVASSPAAWSGYEKKVVQACVAASGLTGATPVGGTIAYDDRVPVTALVLAGRYPQKHMKNAPGRELCVWDRKAEKAYVSEADQLLPAK